MQPEDSENKDNVNNESSFSDEAYAQCIFQFGLILCAIITGNAISCDGHSLQEIRDEVEQNVIDGIPPALEAIAYQCCETLANNRPTDKLIYSEIKDLLETYQPLKEDLLRLHQTQVEAVVDTVAIEESQMQSMFELVSHTDSFSSSYPPSHVSSSYGHDIRKLVKVLVNEKMRYSVSSIGPHKKGAIKGVEGAMGRRGMVTASSDEMTMTSSTLPSEFTALTAATTTTTTTASVDKSDQKAIENGIESKCGEVTFHTNKPQRGPRRAHCHSSTPLLTTFHLTSTPSNGSPPYLPTRLKEEEKRDMTVIDNQEYNEKPILRKLPREQMIHTGKHQIPSPQKSTLIGTSKGIDENTDGRDTTGAACIDVSLCPAPISKPTPSSRGLGLDLAEPVASIGAGNIADSHTNIIITSIATESDDPKTTTTTSPENPAPNSRDLQSARHSTSTLSPTHDTPKGGEHVSLGMELLKMADRISMSVFQVSLADIDEVDVMNASNLLIGHTFSSEHSKMSNASTSNDNSGGSDDHFQMKESQEMSTIVRAAVINTPTTIVGSLLSPSHASVPLPHYYPTPGSPSSVASDKSYQSKNKRIGESSGSRRVRVMQ